MKNKEKVVVEQDFSTEKAIVNISTIDEKDIYTHFNKSGDIEDLSTKIMVNSSQSICKGIIKEKSVEYKRISYLVSAKGDFFLNKTILVVLFFLITVAVYLNWFFIIQILFVFTVICLKKIYDDKNQIISFEPNKVCYRRNRYIEIKSIDKVLVADLKTKTIIEEKNLSYRWYVDSLILEDIGKSDKLKINEFTNVNENIKSIVGRYSILLSCENIEFEILKELSWNQVLEMMKEITD